jgi:small-conductance mechanosensitive channel
MDSYKFIQDKSQYFSNQLSDEKYLSVLIIILILTIFAIIIARLVSGFLLKKIVNTQDRFDKTVSRKIKNLATGSIIFIGIIAVFLVISYNNIGVFWSSSFKIILTIFIVYFTFSIMSIGRVFMRLLSYREKAHFITKQTLPLFQNISNTVILFIAIYITFAFIWGVDMTALLASMGIIGVALSFAARDTIANFLSGIFIMADQPYRVGDFIYLESGERGEVIDIGMRSTRILTVNQVEIIIPNSIMGNTPVVNESGGPSRNTRISVDVQVAYGTNIFLVKNILNSVARRSEYAMQNPPPITRFVKFGESGMHFKLLCWIKEASKRGAVIDELNTWMYEELNKANIEIPYPKQDLYIKEIKNNK